jgi:RHS repeat-associated protein
VSTTDPQGRTTSYGYDAAGERTSISYSDGQTPSVSYSYDADGQRLAMTDGTGNSGYTYDSLGRLTSATNGTGQAVSYGYDLAGNQTSITYPNGKAVTEAYDADGRATGVTDWLGTTTSFGYDADSNETAATYPASTGNTDTYAYNSADQLTSISAMHGSSTLAGFSYTRDPGGQLQSDTSTGVGQGAETYGYTKLNQIGSLNGTNYTYDQAENLTGAPASTSMSYDVANEATALSNGGPTVSFAYDPEGERTQGGSPGMASLGYTYDQAGQLTGVTASRAGATLAGGEGFSLALGQDGIVSAWGGNGAGQLGNGTTTNSSSPVPVSSLASVAAVAAGQNHAVALKVDGTVWAWGSNSSGQLGNGTTANSSIPVQVKSLSGAIAIGGATGGSDSLAVKSDGTVWAWGLNTSGQLGNGSLVNSSTPVQVAGLSAAVAVAGGGTFSLALKSDGTVWAWGADNYGELGNGTTNGSKTPVQVTGLSGVIAIAAGNQSSFALKSDGTVWAWGQNANGELGNGTTTNSPVPVQVTGLSGVTHIAAGEIYAAAVKSDGTAWAWGSNAWGQLGNGTTTDSHTPVQISGATGVATLGAGEYHTLLTTANGMPTAVGKDLAGQLGNGATTNSSTPVPVSGLAAMRALGNTTYSYDGDGLRATTTAAGQTASYVWQTNGSLPLLLTDGTINYIYDSAGLPIEQISASGAVLYYHHDQAGSTRLLTSPSGAVAATYTYDPFGGLISQTGATDTPLRWAGQYQDSTDSIYYLRARYYDPASAQFLTRDPLEAITGSPYGYAADNPVTASDPTGLDAIGWGLEGATRYYTFCAQDPGQCAGSEPTAVDWAVAVATMTAGGAALDALVGRLGTQVAADTVGDDAAATEADSLQDEQATDSCVAAEDTAGVVFRQDTSHIFRNAAGHLADDTPENRAILQDTVNPENLVGTRGPNGSISVYRRLLPDGQQAWVEVRNGTEITNGGVNPTPR